MDLALWIVLGIIGLVVVIFFSYFNRFALLGNRIDNSLSQIDVQLKRRADLIPNLIETVKGFTKHETAAIKAVTDARKALISAGNVEGKVKANEKLESALKSVFAIAENYPNLKANENFLQLQTELATTEDKISYARQYYNDSILSYNTLCTTMPGMFFANLYGKRKREYLLIAEKDKKNVEVKF
jgi:LemA protein